MDLELVPHLSSDNYLDWRAKMKSFLTTKSYEYFITENTIKAFTGTTREQKRVIELNKTV